VSRCPAHARACARRKWRLRLWWTTALAWLASSAPAQGLSFKLWPLVDYQSTPHHRHLTLLGPLFEYEHSADGTTWTLRPLMQLRQRAAAAESELTLLYPLLVSRWDAEYMDVRLIGLVFYQTKQRETAERTASFTLFPFVFYRRSEHDGASLSVVPFYADLKERFGYDRIQMIAFPFYLKLEDDLVEQTWLPFPFVSWSGGTLGKGTRVWPFYGWQERGLSARSEYILWPFYISQDFHYTRPEREHRLLLYPFYASIDSPRVYSRSYFWPFFFPFLSHTIDRAKQTETWGFPWPFWLTRRNLVTDERTALRLTPFYEDTRFDDIHSGFLLWPLYRWQDQESETFVHTRSDVLMVMYRDIRELQPVAGHTRTLQTFFPFYRRSSTNSVHDFSTLALLDALFPRNTAVAEMYAPLWQLYTREQDGTQGPQWSLLWDLVSSDGRDTRYPIDFDFEQ